MSEIKVGSVRKRTPLPQIVLIHSPSEPVENGRNRNKFPSFKDCCVKIAVSNSEDGASGSTIKQQRAPVIRYECTNERRTLDASKNESLVNGPTYLLGISSITRHAINEGTQLLDLPTHMVCQHHPLNYWSVKDIEPSHYGYWFRFFGKSCRFQIMITLKLHKTIPGYVDQVVSTIELNIRNIESAINRKCLMKVPRSKKRDSLLYSEKEYINIMEKLQSQQEHCLWEKCVSVGDELLSSLKKGKSDVKACILLEQSKAVCHQGKFVAAKLLIKKALEAIPAKSQNKDLLIARAYTYLSLCHHYDLSLGSTEECLRIAWEKLINFNPCEDTADLHYKEGQLLLSFLLKLPNFNKQLINEAKEKLEKSICHYRECCNSKHKTIRNKVYNAQLYVALLLLLANPGNDSVIIAEEIISTMFDAHLFQETQCRFNFVKALVLQHQWGNEAPRRNAKVALNLATTCGLYIEKQLIVKCLRSLK